MATNEFDFGRGVALNWLGGKIRQKQQGRIVFEWRACCHRPGQYVGWNSKVGSTWEENDFGGGRSFWIFLLFIYYIGLEEGKMLMDFSSTYFVGSEWQRWGGWGDSFILFPPFSSCRLEGFFLFDCFCFVVSVVSRGVVIFFFFWRGNWRRLRLKIVGVKNWLIWIFLNLI